MDPVIAVSSSPDTARSELPSSITGASLTPVTATLSTLLLLAPNSSVTV